LLCFVGIGALFFLDRDKPDRTAKRFGYQLLGCGSLDRGLRPCGWGSAGERVCYAKCRRYSFDATVFGILLAAGIILLIDRRVRTYACIKANWLILTYFAYCLLSVLWSDFPDITFKRWIKAIGDLTMFSSS